MDDLFGVDVFQSIAALSKHKESQFLIQRAFFLDKRADCPFGSIFEQHVNVIPALDVAEKLDDVGVVHLPMAGDLLCEVPQFLSDVFEHSQVDLELLISQLFKNPVSHSMQSTAQSNQMPTHCTLLRKSEGTQ